MAQTLARDIIKVSELVQLEKLTIPPYQRPYKWTTRNIHQLFQDIQLHKTQSAYRLGTIVFHHDDEGMLNIVDGQQRTLTLVLAVYAIIQERWDQLERQDLSEQLEALEEPIEAFMEAQQFSSDISQRNLHQNYLEIKRLVSRSEFTEHHIDFLLNHCEVVIFSLCSISEAFQFFDSQNARGRDLEPHDLLKAYHLREFSEDEQTLKAETVAGWEALESKELATLFAEYLYRIRRWALGYSARYFSKNEVGLFKGVNIDQIEHFPYVESLRIAHHYVDDYNSQYHRKIDGQKKAFPFHLDQMIINGRRFFEMSNYYQKQVQAIVNAEYGESSRFMDIELTHQALNILRTLNHYPDRLRIGDKYVRAIFDCGLIFYMDKFGTVELSSAIEKIFIWSFRLRIKQQVVQLATMDNHVLNQNLFRLIKDATLPSDVLSMPLQSLTNADNKNNSRKNNASKDPLVKLFKEMNYYE
ncbi:DUF262 domain-containing protein [Oceanospirillum sediminis]|uniref:DUF262 domain-containing protein n=1 Tax=Oceanospirillum sediminis TaxID=2760088 RepID=A0A839IQL3_9GAMM|nr:DUF262 domain-containing protein [Oceanospirillum sediminis]MBB1487000.1 DUF262 domain-containing protein [Oceanospirillum sediminis]